MVSSFTEKVTVFLVIHEIVVPCKAKHDLAIVFIWTLNMIARNMYGCQVVMEWIVVILYYVHLAKLKVCSPEFSSLPGSWLRLVTSEICIIFKRWK